MKVWAVITHGLGYAQCFGRDLATAAPVVGLKP